jgi:hypothetical protein
MTNKRNGGHAGNAASIIKQKQPEGNHGQRTSSVQLPEQQEPCRFCSEPTPYWIALGSLAGGADLFGTVAVCLECLHFGGLALEERREQWVLPNYRDQATQDDVYRVWNVMFDMRERREHDRRMSEKLDRPRRYSRP